MPGARNNKLILPSLVLASGRGHQVRHTLLCAFWAACTNPLISPELGHKLVSEAGITPALVPQIWVPFPPASFHSSILFSCIAAVFFFFYLSALTFILGPLAGIGQQPYFYSGIVGWPAGWSANVAGAPGVHSIFMISWAGMLCVKSWILRLSLQRNQGSLRRRLHQALGKGYRPVGTERTTGHRRNRRSPYSRSGCE